jgi:hypothetical protein
MNMCASTPAPGATRAALSYQRHNLGPEGIAHTRARAERKLAMPVLAVGAEGGTGATLLDTMRLVAADVRGGVFAGCGHYMPEEAPRAVAEQIIRFMGKWARPQARRETQASGLTAFLNDCRTAKLAAARALNWRRRSYWLRQRSVVGFARFEHETVYIA